MKEKKPIVCELCRKGPHDDGFPPIFSVGEAVDLGWTRTRDGGVLDEECASEVLANADPPSYLDGLMGYE